MVKNWTFLHFLVALSFHNKEFGLISKFSAKLEKISPQTVQYFYSLYKIIMIEKSEVMQMLKTSPDHKYFKEVDLKMLIFSCLNT